MSDGIGIPHLLGFYGAVQALVIAVLVGTLGAPRSRLFAALVGALGLAMGVITLSYTPAGRFIPALYPAEISIALLAPPLFYLWVRLTVRGETRLHAAGWLHFAVVAVWLVVAAGLLLRGEEITERTVPIGAVVGYQVLYTGLAAWRVLASRRAPSPGGEVGSDEIVLVRVTLGLFLLLHVAQLVRLLSHNPAVRHIVPTTGAVMVFCLTGLAVRQSRLFASRSDGPPSGGAKYEGSTLTELQAERGLKKLQRAMEDDRAFLRPELTLDELADEIGLPRSHLSQIVNERCGKSFPELLTEYRVAEAQRLLAAPDADHLAVEGIGYRAGFNSRSNFYDAFKRTTGLTPAAYRARRARARTGL